MKTKFQSREVMPPLESVFARIEKEKPEETPARPANTSDLLTLVKHFRNKGCRSSFKGE